MVIASSGDYIDAGVDLVLGHHSHVPKGIEIYKGKVIFHNLGNFAVDVNISLVPTDRWSSIKPRRDKFEPGWEKYPFPTDWRKSMIAKFLISGKKITRVSFLPCMMATASIHEMVDV